MSTKMYETIVEQSNDGIFVAQQGSIVYANPQLHRMASYEPDELVGTPKMDLIAPEDRDRVTDNHAARMAGDTAPETYEVDLLTKTGDHIPVELSVEDAKYKGQTAAYVICRDISERKTRQQALEQSQRRLRVLFNKMPGAIVIHDRAGNIVDVNDETADSLGYSRAELLEMNVLEFEVGLSADELRTYWDSMSIGETVKVDGEHERKDGTRFPAEVWSTKLEVDGEPRYLALARDITERVERKQKLQRLKERLELAVEGAGVGVWDWNMQTDAVEFNEQWAAMLGYSLDDIEPHLDAWEQRVHPEDLQTVKKALSAHKAGEVAHYDCEHRIKTADGNWKWIRDIGKIVDRDDNGEPLRAVGIHIDVDEQKRQERYLKQAQEVADIGWWRKNLPSDRIYWSDHIYEMWGADGDSGYLNYDRFLDFIHSEDADRVDRAWQAALEGEPYEIEHRIVTGDGEVKWMREVAEFSFDSTGEPIEAVGIVQDITDQKAYETKLEAAQSDLRQIIDLVPDLIFAKNRDGEYVFANATTAEYYGLSPDELEGKSEADVLPNVEDSEAFREDDLEVIESGTPKEITEETLTTVDGDTRILQTTKIPYQVHDTGEDAVMGYARDITDLKHYEQQLETQRDNLDILNQVVRHDIRNDLQLIQAYAEMLTETESLSETQQQYLSKVTQSATNAVELTTTARDLSDVMLQEGTELEAVSLRQTLETQIDRLRSSQNKVALTIRGSLPEIKVRADELLNGVFRNILNNAVQHNDKAVPEITVQTHVGDETVTIRIADNGRGISDTHKQEIFERGNQGLESEGTGIGLYLIKTLIDRYGGKVWVEDNEPEGSIFAVKIPRATTTNTH